MKKIIVSILFLTMIMPIFAQGDEIKNSHELAFGADYNYLTLGADNITLIHSVGLDFYGADYFKLPEGQSGWGLFSHGRINFPLSLRKNHVTYKSSDYSFLMQAGLSVGPGYNFAFNDKIELLLAMCFNFDVVFANDRSTIASDWLLGIQAAQNLKIHLSEKLYFSILASESLCFVDFFKRKSNGISNNQTLTDLSASLAISAGLGFKF